MQPILISIVNSNDHHTSFQPDSHSSSGVLRTALLIIVSLCICEISCHNVATTWSAKAPSSDGRWLATARSQQWSGPGNAYDATTVYLKQVNTSESPTQILAFSHQYGTMDLEMEWLGANHLKIKYKASPRPGDHVTLDFQVCKFRGLDISVENLQEEHGY